MDSQLRKTVLVVDDDPTLLELYAEVLELGDYAVISCASGDQALGVLREQVPSLLVLNPGPKGTPNVEVTRMLERDPRLVDVPVLICTTSQRQLNQAPILPRTRAWGVMAKPFDVPRLMEMIDSLACGVSYGESPGPRSTSSVIADVSRPEPSIAPVM
jgi:CheY-like chemotaxis protein